MNEITAEDLDPIVAEAKLMNIPAYCYFARSGRKFTVSQIRLAFTMAYGADAEKEYYKEYRLGIGDKVCPKCLGTGIFAMAIFDGRPWSSTGTDCWKCHGTGFVVRKARKAKS